MSTVNNQPPVTGQTSMPPGPVSGSDQSVESLLNAVLQQSKDLQGILQNFGASVTGASKPDIATVQDAITSTLVSASHLAAAKDPVNTSNPTLQPPNSTGSPPEVTSGNPWLKPSALTAFIAVMFEVASIMSKMKLLDVQNEIRETLFRQESVEANAKNIIDQAKLEMVKAICQAVVSFVSAGLAIGMAVGSARMGGQAEKEVRADAEKLKNNDKCGGNKDVEKWLDNKSQLSTEQDKLNRMVVGKQGEDGRIVTQKEYDAQKQKVDDLQKTVETTKPGFKQFQEYQNENFGVKTSDEGVSQPYSKSNQEKNDTVVENQIKLKEDNKDTSSRNTSEVKDDIKNQTTDKDKNISFTKDEQSKIDKNEKYANEASKEGMKMKNHYDQLSDPSTQTFQTAVNNKMMQKNMYVQAINDANKSIAQALNGLIGAAFDLQIAGEKAEAVYIQATMDGAQKVINGFEENRKSIAQDLNELYSNMMNYIQTYWSGVGSFKQG